MNNGFHRCQACYRRPTVVKVPGEKYIVICHGYSVMRSDLDRCRRLWNIEQVILKDYKEAVRLNGKKGAIA